MPFTAWNRRAGCHADNRHRSLRPLEMRHAGSMIVAMDHELSAMLGDDLLEFAGIPETTSGRGSDAVGRMVDHHDARKPFAVRLCQQRRERVALLVTEGARCQEGGSRDCRGQADECDVATPPEIRKFDLEAPS